MNVLEKASYLAESVEVVIRPYAPGDYPAVLALWLVDKRNPYSEAEIARLVASGGGALVAELPDAKGKAEVVGILLWSHNGRLALIWRLAVAAEHRRRGIATRLLTETEQEIRAAGFKKMGLIVKVDNDEAKALYDREGWSPDDGAETWWKNLPEDCSPSGCD